MGMLKLTAIGNVGSDPEFRTVGQGTALLSFSVAANLNRTEKGQKVKVTHWLRCALFGKRAEAMSRMLHKGKQVYVEGTLNPRLYTDNAGNTKLSLDLEVSDVQLLGSKEDGQQDGQQAAPRQQQRAPQNAPAQQQEDQGDPNYSAGDDSIPF